VVPADIQEEGITKEQKQHEDRPNVGLVVSVGNEVELVNAEDVVFFGEYSHHKIVYNNISYLILREEDIICKVVNTTK
tara:strand:+ start:9858 stop:10091 length:234 start_codon:yes stop_codon:yes gene_type:complete